MTDTSPSPKADNTTAPPTIWIVQKAVYYYNDEYCSVAIDPSGYHLSREQAELECARKNLNCFEYYLDGYYEKGNKRNTAMAKFLALPSDEERIKMIAERGSDNFIDFCEELGVNTDELRNYAVVELKLLTAA